MSQCTVCVQHNCLGRLWGNQLGGGKHLVKLEALLPWLGLFDFSLDFRNNTEIFSKDNVCLFCSYVEVNDKPYGHVYKVTNVICFVQTPLKNQYLLDEVSHFHLWPLLGHVGLHLRIGVIDDGQEHVLYRRTERTRGININTINKRITANGLTHHENEENEEDKACEVDGSKHWIGLLYFRELEVSQNDAELGETTHKWKTLLNDRNHRCKRHFYICGVSFSCPHMLAWNVLKSLTWVPNTK